MQTYVLVTDIKTKEDTKIELIKRKNHTRINKK